MRNSPLGLLVTLICIVGTAAQAAETDALRDEEGSHLDFLRDGKPLLRYMYAFDDSSEDARHNTYKPYHHVFDPAGEQPITKGPGGKFTHHRGIFIGFAQMSHNKKTYDHWHMRTSDKKWTVNMVHQRFLSKQSDKDATSVASLIHWNDPEGDPLLKESRTLTVHHTDTDAHLLVDFVSTLTALEGDVVLKGDPEHAGVQYRPHNDVAGNKSAKYTFHADGVDPRKDQDLPWVAMTYQLGDATYTVQHMRHPDDPSDSVYSAYRDYGRFGNYFVKAIPAGESLTVRYRFRITLGGAPDRKTLDTAFRKYVAE